jgi:hypothetical protein
MLGVFYLAWTKHTVFIDIKLGAIHLRAMRIDPDAIDQKRFVPRVCLAAADSVA